MSELNTANTFSTGISLQSKQSSYVQNYILVWFDPNIDVNDSYYQSSISQFRNIINSIETFIDIDQCIDFITDIIEEKVFLIISTSLAQQYIPLIYDLSQINSIYIFYRNQTEFKMLNKLGTKLKGIFIDINDLCESLKLDTRRCDYNMVSISIMKTTQSLHKDKDELDQSFMYSQLLKDTLLDMNYGADAKQCFVDFCRQQYHNNVLQLQVIDEFEREYHMHSPIWWYTRDCFLYYMLNKALRTQQIDIIIKMAFFLQDIHQEIQTLYKEISINSTPFTVYRGQGISKTEFEQIKANKGALLAFNSFLSTSTDRHLSFMYAESAAQDPDLNGILFEMSVDPTNTSHPFATLNQISYFNDTENEILFSMHTIFRISDIKELKNRVTRVNLILTNEEDHQLRALKEYFQAEDSSNIQWIRLANLMVRMGEFDKAEEFYKILHDTEKEDDISTAVLYSDMGRIRLLKGDYKQSILFYEKVLETIKNNDKLNRYDISSTYSNLALAHTYMGNYHAALPFYQQAVKLFEKQDKMDQSNACSLYLNMGGLYTSIGEYPTALAFYKKALKISTTNLPKNHPLLSNIYNSMGETYRILGEYSMTAFYFQKALEIREKTLPPDHPLLATIYNNIAVAYQCMNDTTNSLLFLEKALEISKKTIGEWHPNLANTYFTLGCTCNNRKDYSNGLFYSEKAFHILQQTLSQDHPVLATVLNNIGFAYQGLEDYLTALSYYEKTLDIQQKIFSSAHTDVARTYNNIGCCYLNIKQYESAISFFQKALNIRQKCLHPFHPSMASIFKSMTQTYMEIRDYSKAQLYLMKSLEIIQNTPQANDDDLADIYRDIGLTYLNMKSYTNALMFYTKALNIRERSLPPDSDVCKYMDQEIHITKDCSDTSSFSEITLQMKQKSFYQPYTKLAMIYKNIGFTYRLIEDYANALSFYQKALNIEEKFSSSDDYELSITYNNLGLAHMDLTHYSIALSFFEKTLEIRKKKYPLDHSVFFKVYNNIGVLYKHMKNYSTSLSFLEKALKIGQKNSFSNDPLLISIYSHLVEIYRLLGDNEKASLYVQLILKLD